MDEGRIIRIILKKLTNSCSALEKEELEEWLTDQENQKLYRDISNHWFAGIVEQSDSSEVFGRVIERVDGSPQRKPQKKVRLIYWLTPVRAAVIFFLLTASAVLYFYSANFDKLQSSSPSRLIEKSNGSGQKSTVYLSDGSKVILNSKSSISYSEPFVEKRQILLNGEAFFEVAKDTLRPFVVLSGRTSTTALGTSFNIRNNGDRRPVDISLVTGKVLVEVKSGTGRKENSYSLLPGEQAHFDPSLNNLSIRPFNRKEVLSWKEGIIYFNEASQEEMFLVLERWYGVEFRFEDQPDRDWTYSGEFDNMSLDLVLSTIGFSEGFEFAIHGKEVVIVFIK